jgi:hypothetical protein
MEDFISMAEEQKLTHAELEKMFQESAKKGDWKAARQYASQLEASEKAEETAKKEARSKLLEGLTDKVIGTISKALAKMKDGGELDEADGVWFSWDFGEPHPSGRLMKSAPRKAAAGGGTGNGSYISRPEKTADLIAQVGSHVMFKEATLVTIDKVEQTMAAGTTFKQAHDASNNGGWRNRVRMALLKEAGLV